MRIKGLGAFLNKKLREFSKGKRYEGPWVVGFQDCSLCGQTQAAIAPLASLDGEGLYECVCCGQQTCRWNYDPTFAPKSLSGYEDED